MLCHLGDTSAQILRSRPRPVPLAVRPRRVVKLLGLWLPMPWPRGLRTSAFRDPRLEGTQPSDFAADRLRVLEGLVGVATADADALDNAHGIFGTMTVRDWQRYTYRHTDYHLRQFGL